MWRRRNWTDITAVTLTLTSTVTSNPPPLTVSTVYSKLQLQQQELHAQTQADVLQSASVIPWWSHDDDITRYCDIRLLLSSDSDWSSVGSYIDVVVTPDWSVHQWDSPPKIEDGATGAKMMTSSPQSSLVSCLLVRLLDYSTSIVSVPVSGLVNVWSWFWFQLKMWKWRRRRRGDKERCGRPSRSRHMCTSDWEPFVFGFT